MQKDRLDEMRKKLKVENMGESTKKDMFNKFVQAGGQIVDLNKKNLKESSSPNKIKEQTPENKNIYLRNKRFERKETTAVPLEKTAPVEVVQNRENQFGLWMEKFTSKISCYFSGIISFNEKSFNSSFQEFILITYQNMLLNSRMILASIIYQDKLVANEIKKRFAGENNFQYYFELIFRFDNLYSEEMFHNLNAMKNNVNSVQESKKDLLDLFKGLFILQPYYISIKNAIEKALVFEKELRRMDSNITFENIRKMFSYLEHIFLKVYLFGRWDD